MSTPARWVGFGCAAARVCCAARECWPARCTAARSPPHLLAAPCARRRVQGKGAAVVPPTAEGEGYKA